MQGAMGMTAERAAEDANRKAKSLADAQTAAAEAEDAVRDEPAAEALAEDGPLRRCIATRQVKPKEELLRFVAGPDNELVPDLAGKLPGRGLWVSADRAALDLALQKNLFAKAAKAPLRVPAGLADEVARLLRRRCLELIGLARGAGQAVAGYEKVDAWLEQGRVAVLLEACDGAADGKRRLAAKAGATYIGMKPATAERPPVVLVDLFTAAELASALGREHVVHAALSEGGLARALLADAARLKAMIAGHNNG
jgi:predicted RNA-binding protein YlxR (DUF448 family)